MTTGMLVMLVLVSANVAILLSLLSVRRSLTRAERALRRTQQLHRRRRW